MLMPVKPLVPKVMVMTWCIYVVFAAGRFNWELDLSSTPEVTVVTLRKASIITSPIIIILHLAFRHTYMLELLQEIVA